MKKAVRKAGVRTFFEISGIIGIFHAKGGVKNTHNGRTLTEAQDIKERWKEYTYELYRKENSIHSTYKPADYQDEPDILESEVRAAIKSLPKGKSMGVDEIPELLQVENDETAKVTTTLCNKICSKA